MSGKTETVQVVRGAMLTPSGDKIPMKVRMRPVSGSPAYTHIGEIDIPTDWIGEFEQSFLGFVFRSEDGECFTQYQILEETTAAKQQNKRLGRIILMRDLRGADISEMPPVLTRKTPHLQLVGA
jgi:hypothetical protein